MVLNDLLEKPHLEREFGFLVVVDGLGTLGSVAVASEDTLRGAVPR